MKTTQPHQNPLHFWLKAGLTCFVFVTTFWWAARQTESTDLASTADSHAIQATEILQKIQKLRADIQDLNAFNSVRCAEFLNKEYTQVFDLNPQSLDLNSIGASAKTILDAVFTLRLELRDRYRSLSMANGFPESCVNAHRRAYRAMRVFEDYLGEASLGFPYNEYLDHKEDILNEKRKQTTVLAFQNSRTNTLWNPKYAPQNLDESYIPRSGDLILSRGTASTSAAIARITDEDSNFSHLSMVYYNPNLKKFETIEAHIEIGSNVFDYQKDYITDGKVRAAVFRLNDRNRSDDENMKLAEKAAQSIRDYVANYKTEHNGSSICYNFTMRMDKENCLFCSQLVSFAYKLASPDFNLPKFQSSIHPRNRSFVDMMGMQADRTFAPADIELDPRFELVAEWRDYNRVHHAHLLDAILTAMYNWMDKDNYELRPSFFQGLSGGLAFFGRRIPLVDVISGLDSKFPLNMPPKTLNGVRALNSTTNAMKAYLDDQEEALGRNGFRRLTPKQMLEKLEDLRKLQGTEGLDKEYDFRSYFKSKN